MSVLGDVSARVWQVVILRSVPLAEFGKEVRYWPVVNCNTFLKADSTPS